MVAARNGRRRTSGARRSSTRRSTCSPSRACTAPRPRRSPAGPASRSRTSSASSARRRSSTSAVVARCFRADARDVPAAAEGKRGEEALRRDREAYGELLAADRDLPARARCRRTRPATTRRSAPSSATASATSSPTSSASRASSRRTISRVLRQRDAAERLRLDGLRDRPSPGRARLARGLQVRARPSFFRRR